MQHFKFVNWWIRGFVFWCHQQVHDMESLQNNPLSYEFAYYAVVILWSGFISYSREAPFRNILESVDSVFIIETLETLEGNNEVFSDSREEQQTKDQQKQQNEVKIHMKSNFFKLKFFIAKPRGCLKNNYIGLNSIVCRIWI